MERAYTIVLYPGLEQTRQAIQFFNRNLREGGFPLLGTQNEFDERNANEWFRKTETKDHIRAIALSRKNDVVGLGYLKRKNFENACISITVDMNFRNRGIGADLCKSLVDEAKKVGIRRISDTTPKENVYAMKMLRKAGFKNIGEKERRIGKDRRVVSCSEMMLELDNDTGRFVQKRDDRRQDFVGEEYRQMWENMRHHTTIFWQVMAIFFLMTGITLTLVFTRSGLAAYLSPVSILLCIYILVVVVKIRTFMMVDLERAREIEVEIGLKRLSDFDRLHRKAGLGLRITSTFTWAIVLMICMTIFWLVLLLLIE